MLTFDQKIQAYKDASDIVEYFDFWKVQKVMQALNWTYWDSKDIPSVQRLKETAGYVLTSCIEESCKNNSDTFFSSIGGFTAEVNIRDDSVVLLRLSFNIEEGDNYELH